MQGKISGPMECCAPPLRGEKGSRQGGRRSKNLIRRFVRPTRHDRGRCGPANLKATPKLHRDDASHFDPLYQFVYLMVCAGVLLATLSIPGMLEDGLTSGSANFRQAKKCTPV